MQIYLNLCTDVRTRSTPPPPPPEFQDSDDEFEVEAILQHQIRTTEAGETIKYYLVSWIGYGDEDNTWEPASNIGSGAIQDYEERRELTHAS